MTSDKTPEGGESIVRLPEDDVEGHRPSKPGATPDEDDVEGHRPSKPGATPDEDDVEGHRLVIPRADGTEDDVEGHNIGYGSPTLARTIYRDREREIQREMSRSSLLRDAKLVIKKRKG